VPLAARLEEGEHITAEVPRGLSAQTDARDAEPLHLPWLDLEPIGHLRRCEEGVRGGRERHGDTPSVP